MEPWKSLPPAHGASCVRRGRRRRASRGGGSEGRRCHGLPERGLERHVCLPSIRSWHLSPSGPGCRAVIGPVPTATLDGILARLAAKNRAKRDVDSIARCPGGIRGDTSFFRSCATSGEGCPCTPLWPTVGSGSPSEPRLMSLDRPVAPAEEHPSRSTEIECAIVTPISAWRIKERGGQHDAGRSKDGRGGRTAGG